LPEVPSSTVPGHWVHNASSSRRSVDHPLAPDPHSATNLTRPACTILVELAARRQSRHEIAEPTMAYGAPRADWEVYNVWAATGANGGGGVNASRAGERLAGTGCWKRGLPDRQVPIRSAPAQGGVGRHGRHSPECSRGAQQLIHD